MDGKMKKPTVTLDTNSIIDLESDPDLQILHKLHEEGKIEIVKTDVVDTELMGGKSEKKSKDFKEDMGDAVVGHSRLDHAKVG